MLSRLAECQDAAKMQKLVWQAGSRLDPDNIEQVSESMPWFNDLKLMQPFARLAVRTMI